MDTRGFLAERERSFDDHGPAAGTRRLLASYLCDLLDPVEKRSSDAATQLRLAICALDPDAIPDNNHAMRWTRSALVAALAHALADTKTGSGPYLWITATIDILERRVARPVGTS